MKIDGWVEDLYQALVIAIPPDDFNRTLIPPWTHSFVSPEPQLCDDAPLSGIDGQMGNSSVTKIDGLIDAGYMIGTIDQISEMVPIDALILS